MFLARFAWAFGDAAGDLCGHWLRTPISRLFHSPGPAFLPSARDRMVTALRDGPLSYGDLVGTWDFGAPAALAELIAEGRVTARGTQGHTLYSLTTKVQNG